MKRAVLALLLAPLCACGSSSPVSISAPATPTSLDCALTQATDLGYSVESAEAGLFFRARKPNGFRFEVLNASVSQGVLTVTASQDVRSPDGAYAQGPDRQTARDAEAVANSCTTSS